MGRATADRPRLSRPLRLPHRHHQQPHPGRRRRERDLSLQEPALAKAGDRAADRQRKETVAGHEFIRRFLQHVLPAGFHKVRYYGLWHASRREPLRNLRNLLLLAQPVSPPAEHAAPEPDGPPRAPPSPRPSPNCEPGHLTLLRRLSPARPQGP